MILLAIGLIFSAGTAYAAQVSIIGPSEVHVSATEFSFDIVISDIGSLANWDAWNLDLVMGPDLHAGFVGFDATMDSNPDYVLFDDSDDYAWNLTKLTAFGGL